MSSIGYEIDYLAVGEGERSSDAICLRYGNLAGRRDEQTVMTIDGGTLDSGNLLVAHVKKYYGTDVVDIALLSHPDVDHASGMRQVLEGLKVQQVVMHLPWNHSTDVKALLDDARVSANSIKERAKRTLSAAREIEQLATRKNIPIVEPFAGCKNSNGLIVLGPTVEFYQAMLASFKFMPGATEAASSSLGEAFKLFAKTAVNWVLENILTETLQEPAEDATSPENNSSVIFVISIDGKKLLFTGDAGVTALNAAVSFATTNAIPLTGINFFDVPHHGSRRNLGPSILNRLFGNIRSQDSQDWTAFISAAKDGAPKHPHKKVTNALRRRGARVHVTAGQNIWHNHLAPGRGDYSTITPLPLFTQVEDDD
jgi:beta-lactamase superfamily II metal-dependent hydrolase